MKRRPSQDWWTVDEEEPLVQLPRTPIVVGVEETRTVRLRGMVPGSHVSAYTLVSKDMYRQYDGTADAQGELKIIVPPEDTPLQIGVWCSGYNAVSYFVEVPSGGADVYVVQTKDRHVV